MEIPVFLFTGFLESGKTSFIQEALQGSEFITEERTLLLLCEEGEEELHPSRFFGTNIFVEVIEDEADLTEAHLKDLTQFHRVERVIVEYNGMWMLKAFYDAMPPEWIIYQQMLVIDATTFVAYNQNMRQLMFDKMQGAEMVVFNRCQKGFDQMPFHKAIRTANRKSQIIYEYGKDEVELDRIPDPLPYDLNQTHLEIQDDAFAEWYRDINEEQDQYEGKILHIKGRSVLGGGLSKDQFVFGRHVMTCCAEDIQFAGLVCKYGGASSRLVHGAWVMITAKVKNEYSDMYGEVGPVLYCSKVEPAEMPDPEVATF